MRRNALLGGLSAAFVLAGLGLTAHAAPTGAHVNGATSGNSAVQDVRWVCGPRRCAYLPGYEGRVVVHPYMRGWEAPPHPNCHYVRGPERWGLECP
jgi:hypothetical protein